MSDSTAISQETVSGPSGPEPLILPLAQVLPYDLNPRQSINQEFERIKASIREVGLDQPLTVTRRPGASDYMVHSGGNTRLQALKALHTETGDDRFSSVPCLFKPWIRESAVLLAHLRENDLRGGLSYIEKSQAVLQLKTLLEQEQGQALSQRELETALSQGGFALASGQLTRMSYAVHILLPLIPQALYAGMGRPQVQRIRALQRAALSLWQEWELGEEAAFDTIFAELCRRYDSPEWEMELLRGALENELAEQAETSVHLIRVALEGELQGYQVYIPPEPEPDQSSSGNDACEITDRSEQTGLVEIDLPRAKGESGSQKARNTLASMQTDQPVWDRPVADFTGIDRDISTTLYQLRQRALDQATRLAQRHGLGELVVPLPELGLGFTLRDLPDPTLSEQLDEATLDQLALIWWHLAACAELTVAPAQALVPYLAPESVLRPALVQRDLTSLFQQVRCFDPGQSGYRLWRQLGDADWADLLGLMESYRQLHHLAEAQGVVTVGSDMNQRTKESDLITAVLLYALRSLAEGDLAALRHMNFGPKEIASLRALHLSDLYRVESLRAHCLRIQLDRQVYWPMVDNLQRQRRSEELQHDLIAADAPLEMMQTLFGIGAREYTHLRRSLSSDPAVGRPPEPDEATSHALWAVWKQRVDPEQPDLLAPEVYLEIHRETGIGLRAIWHLTRQWAEYGDLSAAQTSDRNPDG